MKVSDFAERCTESICNGLEFLGGWLPENGGLYPMNDPCSASRSVSMTMDLGWCAGDGSKLDDP